MARLPRYQRAGVRARQPQSIDFAGFREQAQLGEQVSRSFDQMSQFLYQTGAEEAERRGIERIRTEGAQPVLEALRDQGGPRTVAERSAYEAGNRVAVAEIQAEADLEITKILTEGQNNKASFSAIQSQLQDVTDGFPAALANIDPASAGILRARLSDAAGKAEMRYSKWWTGEQTKLRKEKQNRVSANEAESIIGNATLPGYSLDEIDEDIKTGAEKLVDLGVKPELIVEWSDGVRDKAIKEKTLVDFYQMPIAEQGAEIEKILSKEKTLPGMDFEQSVRFVNGLLRPEYNRNVAAVKAQADFVVDKIEDQQDILESGGRLSQETMSDMRNSIDEILEADPQRGPALQAAMKDLQADDEFFTGLRTSSLTEVERQVYQLQSGIQDQGGEGIDTALEVKRYEQASKFFTEMQTQIKNDPMGYAERVGFIQDVEPVISFDDGGRPVVNESALRIRQNQAQAVANHYGLAVPRLLFGDEARKLGLILDKAEGAAKLDILGALSTFDQAAGQVLTDLAEYNPEMALIGALVNEGRIETANIAVAGLERLKAGEKPVGFTDIVTGEVISDFGRAITTPKQHQAIKDIARAIYTDLSANKGIFEFNADLYKKAYQMAAGQTERNGVVYGGIQEVRGVQTFVMPSMTVDDLETSLEIMSPEIMEIATGQKISDRLSEEIRENDNYKLRHIGGDKYTIEYGENGEVFVSDENGVPITFSMKDALAAPQKFALMPGVLPAPDIEDAMLSGDIDISSAKMDATRSQDKSSARKTAPEAEFTEGFPRVITPRPSQLDAVSKTFSDPTQDFAPGQIAAGLEASIGAPTVGKGQTIKELRTERFRAMSRTIPKRHRVKRKDYLDFIEAGLKKDPNFNVSWDDWIKTQ
jgi:hypothetical protein